MGQHSSCSAAILMVEINIEVTHNTNRKSMEILSGQRAANKRPRKRGQPGKSLGTTTVRQVQGDSDQHQCETESASKAKATERKQLGGWAVRRMYPPVSEVRTSAASEDRKSTPPTYWIRDMSWFESMGEGTKGGEVESRVLGRLDGLSRTGTRSPTCRFLYIHN